MKKFMNNTVLFIFLFLAFSDVYSQMPSAISITPADATCFEEITLTFYPDSACVLQGRQNLAGLDSIAMHSSAVLVNEVPYSWYHIVEYNESGFDGTLPHLYANPDGTYSITFNPSKFYGTGNTPIIGISAVFNDCFGWEREGKDHAASGCMDFYIPLTAEKTSVTLNVNMSHQCFLGNFDPLFDFIDVAGSFNNWGNPGTTMSDPDNDSIYSVTIPDLVIGQTIEYKFRINKDWGSSELANWAPNRVYVVQSSENILTHWYDDAQPIMKIITLNVNMNYQLELGNFDPAEDTVDVAGNFNNWSQDSLTILSDPEDDLIYSVQIGGIYIGQSIQYKFRLDGSWDMGRHELPGAENNRMYTVIADTNVVDHWYNNENPQNIPDLFFSEYLDGSGSNNAITITNRTGNDVNLSHYGILYTVDGGDVQGPFKLHVNDTLSNQDSYLIVNPGFDFSAIDSAHAVDTVMEEITSFDGNDALALVKMYDSDTKYRIIDRIGILSVNPGQGWDVAGTANATKDKRLLRKSAVRKGQPDWEKSAGTNPSNSEWTVHDPDIPVDLGIFRPFNSLGNQWYPQSSGTNQTLRSIFVGNHGGGITVGDNDTVLTTTNNGLTWIPLDIGTSQPLYDVFFLPDGQGWTVGRGGTILHTADGISWEPQTFGAGNWLESVFFLDPLYGYAAGEYAILHTTDGGLTWNWQSAEELGWFNNIFFTDRDNGWIVAWNMVLHTGDGGQTWEKAEIDPELHFFNVFFFDRLNGWLTGHDGVLMHTTDGGKNWSQQVIQMEGTIRNAYFVTPDIGWVVGDVGKIFFTDDGGITWKEQNSGTWESLTDIFFVTRNKGWIVGTNGTILSTLDGWNNQVSPSPSLLYSVSFTDERTGWVAGEQGTILKTTDAGQTWDTIKKIHLTPSEPHYDIFFTDQKNGWVASSGGYIYHTNDGGLSWSNQYTGVPDWFQSAFFLDNNHGWAVAGGGKIARTNDGGDNWNTVTMGNKLYTDIFFINDSTGWLCGEQGIILKSTNGGENWTTQFTPGEPYLEALYFSDENNGVAVGGGGTILKTTDGGENWNPVNSGTVLHLSGLYFLNPQKGWACGENGVILHTPDGGNTWNTVASGTDKWLRDLFFVDADHGWAVGADGIILQTSSGGCSDPFVDLPRYLRICDGESIEIDAGVCPAYLWNTGDENRTITVSNEGYYGVMVRNICNHTSSDSVFLDVTELPDFQIMAEETPVFCKGEDVGVYVYLLNDDKISDYSYQWDRILMDTEVVKIDTAGFFAVTVTDHFGCKQKDSIEVTVQYPYENEKIGVVTFDPFERKNLVVWEKTPGKGTKFYNIYKVLADQKKYLGSVNYSDLTVFTDTTSNPRQQSDRYVITVVDTCKNESFYSASHKTMHLTANTGTTGEINLIWEHYEGLPVSWYYIFRGVDSTAMEVLDSIAYDISKTQYTDENPPAYKVYYQIGIKLPEIIILSQDKKADSGPYSHSMSNLEDNRLQGTGLNSIFRESGTIEIYPNPFTDKTIIRFHNPDNATYQLKVRDLSGKLVRQPETITGSEIEFSRGNLSPGYYFIEITGDQIFRGKMVIE